MYLSAALLPPPHITRAVHDEVALRCAPPPRNLARPLRVVPPARMSSHLTRFGYVVPDEVDGLRKVVAEQLGAFGTFSLSIGGSVRVDHARRLVVLGLGGEIDRLEAVFQTLHAGVQRAGFVQDRRRFEPVVPVLAFRPDISRAVLTRTTSLLEDYASDAWPVTSIGLVRRELSGRDARAVVLDRLALGLLGRQSLP